MNPQTGKCIPEEGGLTVHQSYTVDEPTAKEIDFSFVKYGELDNRMK